MLTENKFSKYFLYAIGEIVLVVIGILIALQINNQNEARKERDKEVSYLKNLKVDLLNELENNDFFATYHFETAGICSSLLATESPNTIKKVQEYTNKYETVFFWQAFVPNNNTFKELLSSGNLNLIKDDSIKNGLLELEKLYAQVSSTENHMRREYEEFLYNINIENTSALNFFDLSKATYGIPNRLTIEEIPQSTHKKLIEDAQRQHNNEIFRNGIKLAFMNNSYKAGMHKNLLEYIHKLIKTIDEEIEK